MNSTSGSDDQFLLPKTTSFFPNSIFNKNRKAKGCATYVFAYCHKPAMTTHQIFHITKPNYILCLITTLIYQLGYISCSVMRCVGASQEQTMAVTKHLFSFRKPLSWKHLFLRSSTLKTKPNLSPPYNSSIWMHATKHFPRKCYLKLRQFSIF